MDIGDKVTVHAGTQKGKNRINEHGSLWIVRCRNPRGEFVLESALDGYLKVYDNKDFIVLV